MRISAKAYDGSTFTTEKVVATVYALMFIAILLMGQLDRLKSEAPEPEEFASVAETK